MYRADPPKDNPLNVLGEPLKPCGSEKATGFYRDGCCNTGRDDRGRHVICAVMTAEFLEFSRAHGNDLMTPRPEFDFPGLQPGDVWCLCAARWREAMQANAAPRVYLQSTHIRALDIVSIEALKRHALDLS